MTFHKVTLLMLGLAGALLCGGYFIQSVDQLFQTAVYQEEVEGNLKGAVETYQMILNRFPGDRSMGAKALLRIGLCREKLGLREAREAYQRIIDQYSEQRQEVALAQERIAKLGKALAVQEPIEGGKGDLRIRKVPELIGGRISRDGRWICGTDSTGDLFVMEVGTGSKRRLTRNASWDKGDFVDYLAMSPDSKRVAFVWFRDYPRNRDLKVINIDGTGERTLRTDADPSAGFWLCDWTPDGRYFLGITSKESEPSRFVFLSVSDGAIQVVKNVGALHPQSLEISPDGRWIAYDFAPNEDTGVRDIFLLSADGSREIPLVQHPADDCLLGWAPGGDQILFSSDRVESGTFDVWIVPVEDGKARGAPVLVRRDVGRRAIVPMGITQDGSFYYTVVSAKSDVYLAGLDPEKAKVTTPAKNIAQGSEGANRCPAWSPDGRYLAYISDRESGGLRSTALCILSLDTGEYRVLFPQLGSMSRVSWFADGESVLAISGGSRSVNVPTGGVRLANWGSICQINVKTAGVRTLIADDGTGIHSPRCTPDGKKVLYANDSPRDKLCRIISYDVESGQKKEIYRSSQMIARMDISPDGKLLAFLDSTDNALKVMPTEGGSPRVLYKLESTIRGTAWSPDAKYIYLARYIKGTQRQELWRIPSAGGEPVRFDLAADGSMENLDIHPDGRRIVFDSQRSGQDVWVMENFLPKRK